jgi:molybdate transport system substrate-binding protein
MTEPCRLAAVLLAVLLWLGPAGHTVAATAEPSGEVVVMAAASLTAAFLDVALHIRDTHPELKIVYNFAGSQALRTQLGQGAVADVFASANDIQMRRALDDGLIEGAPQVFARNTLVVIVPVDNPGRLTSFEDLAKDGLKLALAGPQVPVGRYSREALLAGQADYGEDFAARVLRNLVTEETSVRQVLVKVQLGEADAGIVYASDVSGNVLQAVSAIPIPHAYNRLAGYPIAVTQAARNPTGAAAFIRYVLSAPGQAKLMAHGFIPVVD